jgi:hypothetical protein
VRSSSLPFTYRRFSRQVGHILTDSEFFCSHAIAAAHLDPPSSPKELLKKPAAKSK